MTKECNCLRPELPSIVLVFLCIVFMENSKAKKAVAYLHCNRLNELHYPDDCPFKTERAGETKNILQRLGMFEGEDYTEVSPIPATTEEMTLFHTPEYLSSLKRVSEGNFIFEDLLNGLGGAETPVFRDLYEYSALAAGASLTGARLILDGEAHIAFNPSGGFHHAKINMASGFCYVNDVVLAAILLSRAGKRVCCIDLDAHHGDGTAEAFYKNSNVLTVSFHEKGIFPFTGSEDEIGEGEGKGYCVNVPLPPRSDDYIFSTAYNELISPLLNSFEPDVIILELGMDVLAGDPLTHLKLTNNAFADCLHTLLKRNIPMLVVGGGGYNAASCSRAWALYWTILTNQENQNVDPAAGMGGIFLQSSDWYGGLRDVLPLDQSCLSPSQQDEYATISATMENSLKRLVELLSPFHKF